MSTFFVYLQIWRMEDEIRKFQPKYVSFQGLFFPISSAGIHVTKTYFLFIPLFSLTSNEFEQQIGDALKKAGEECNKHPPKADS